MSSNPKDREKEIAALESLKYIKDGMKVGLGTGSTAAHMVKGLGRLVANGLQVVGVPSSDATETLAIEVGIPLTTLDKAKRLDVTIDGADEFDGNFQLIKGGGGALLREKILAYNTDINIIIADAAKQVERLGKFKLPVETIQFATTSISKILEEMSLSPILRMKADQPYTTDEGNFILDIDIFDVDDLTTLNTKLISIPGVVETGLFLDTTSIVIVGQGETTKTLKK
ncbi:ribose-5-phosphate isomerase RpiA [Croceivirga thetidis]|uniref:Ribose-5-phosphate isomerase A n=1 Tax=Croceivirga thetidis TaxID=2721623 RepID=A0ABX1GTZ9_9FLAO|nr:ribose-5-phosphate isomerase RpiA [Croceivirga thetidis]NKI32496.1 ribose-5-phosphate isomerase RpiA [Croceivirga thetidis]